MGRDNWRVPSGAGGAAWALSLSATTTVGRVEEPAMLRSHVLRALLALAAVTSGAARGEFTFLLDPSGAYLRVNDEAPPDAVPIDLFSLGINPGDMITITRLGDYQRSTFMPFDTDTFLDVTAVFSSSNSLGQPGDLNRVVGALAAGVEFMTVPTFRGDLPTDIPEDFEVSNFDGTITSVTVQVPTGARFLFVSTADSLFFDNSDPNGNFGVQITVVPEPSTLVLVGVGFLGAIWWRKAVRARSSTTSTNPNSAGSGET